MLHHQSWLATSPMAARPALLVAVLASRTSVHPQRPPWLRRRSLLVVVTLGSNRSSLHRITYLSLGCAGRALSFQLGESGTCTRSRAEWQAAFLMGSKNRWPPFSTSVSSSEDGLEADRKDERTCLKCYLGQQRADEDWTSHTVHA